MILFQWHRASKSSDFYDLRDFLSQQLALFHILLYNCRKLPMIDYVSIEGLESTLDHSIRTDIEYL